MTEQWLMIPDHPDYKLSTKGRLYNIRTNRFVSASDHNAVTLYTKGQGQGEPWSIHVLMGCTFLGNDINDPYRNRVLFKDKNSSNVNLENLYVEDTSDLPGEEWRPFTEFNGHQLKDYYRISNKGRVKSVRHTLDVTYYGKTRIKYFPDIIMQTAVLETKYIQAVLHTVEGKGISVPVHRMVAFAFIHNPDPEHKIFVNHIDGNPSNNCVENLEWCTPRENVVHAYRTGLMDNAYHERLRYPVLHVETGQFYHSMSEVERAMGRSSGYICQRIKLGKKLVDAKGVEWTLEIYKDTKQRIYGDGKACYFEEFPGLHFISMLLASEFIGKSDTYIADCMYTGLPVLDMDKKELHIHFIDPELERQYQSGEMIKRKKEYQPRVGRPYKRGVSQLCYIEEAAGLEFSSTTQLSRFLGKAEGYIGDCIRQNTQPKNNKGELVHFHFVDLDLDAKYQSGELIQEKYRNKGSQGKRKHFKCYIEECPGVEFEGPAQVAKYIGRAGGYIQERIESCKPILSSDNQIIHFHFIEEAKEAKLQSDYYSVVDLNVAPKKKNLFNINS